MSDAPYWLAFGDIHDDFSRFAEIPEVTGASGVIVTGDITLWGGVSEALRALEPIAARVPRLLAQIGNMDKDEVTGCLEERGWNLHAAAREIFPGVFALGVGASPPTPFGTPSEHPESRLGAWMKQALAEARKAHSGTGAPAGRLSPADHFSLVLVSHTPPRASACDRLHSGAPAGSVSVREFIEEQQPELCLCGHIHESRAEDRIGKTHVINPGPLKEGGYVLLRLAGEGGKPRVLAELKILG